MKWLRSSAFAPAAAACEVAAGGGAVDPGRDDLEESIADRVEAVAEPELADLGVPEGHLEAEGVQQRRLGGTQVGGDEADLSTSPAGDAAEPLPANAAEGEAVVTVRGLGGVVATGTLQIARVAPALFAANADGQGVAAALIQRVRPDGSQAFEAAARFGYQRRL